MKMMKNENVARGLGISYNKGPDSAINYVGNTKVLPLTDAALSFRHQYVHEREIRKLRATKLTHCRK